MANKRISDLTPATLIDNTWLMEVAKPGVESDKATQIQVRQVIEGLQDSMAYDHFDDYSVAAITAPSQGIGWGATGVTNGSSIISSTMADGRIHNRLALNNGSYGRAMPWGAFWNRVKIVIACRINNNANMANCNGYIGICSGTANMVDSANTTNFVGIRVADGTGTATITAGTKISYYNMPTWRAVTRRVNTTTDRGALSSGHSTSADGGYLSTVICEISRPVFLNAASSVNYSVAEGSNAAAAVEFSHSKDVAKLMAMGDVTPNLANSGSDSAINGGSGVTAAPFAFDESAGVLDTVNIYWPQAFNFEIAALVVRKVA